MTSLSRLWRDWGAATLVTFAVLLAIVAGGRLLGYLDDAVDERLPVARLWIVIALRLPEFTQLLLPLAACVGVALVHGRMQAERELVALAAAGESPWAFSLRALGFGALIALIVALCSVWLTPLAQRELACTLAGAATDQAERLLAPGRFRQFDAAGGVLFVAGRQDDRAQDVLLARPVRTAVPPHAWTILRARQAQFVGAARPYVLLRDGVRSRLDARSSDWQQLRFAHAKWLLPPLTATPPAAQAALDLRGLLHVAASPSARAAAWAELYWRASLPLLALFAVLIVVVAPPPLVARGRYAVLLLCLPLFAVLLAAIVLARQWLASAPVLQAPLALLPHGIAWTSLALWLWHRQVRG